MIRADLTPFAAVTLTLDELIILGDWATKQKQSDDSIMLQIVRNTAGTAEVIDSEGNAHQITPLGKRRFGT